MGIIKENAALPVVNKVSPKEPGLLKTKMPPTAKPNAIKRPPATTKGIMKETPVIKCL
ncbi:hypothetical protein D3C73_1617740 [compost metagenome]